MKADFKTPTTEPGARFGAGIPRSVAAQAVEIYFSNARTVEELAEIDRLMAELEGAKNAKTE